MWLQVHTFDSEAWIFFFAKKFQTESSDTFYTVLWYLNVTPLQMFVETSFTYIKQNQY